MASLEDTDCLQKITWSTDNNYVLEVSTVFSYIECFTKCVKNQNCYGNTWYGPGQNTRLQNICVLFRSILSSDHGHACTGCQSQKMRNYGISCWCVECPDCECNIPENNFLGFGHFNYEVECLRNCMDNPECKYYTWYGRDNSQFQNQCFLFSSSDSTTQCKGCYGGARKCVELD